MSSSDESSSESELKASSVSIVTLSSFSACILSLSDLNIYMLCTTIVSPLSLSSLIGIVEVEIEV